MFEELALAAGDDEQIDRDTFNLAFDDIINADAAKTEADFVMLSFIKDRLFDVFDTDGNGLVDFTELTSGLTVLCGGSREEKMKVSTVNLYENMCVNYG